MTVGHIRVALRTGGICYGEAWDRYRDNLWEVPLAY